MKSVKVRTLSSTSQARIGGSALTPAVMSTRPPWKVVRKASLSSRTRDIQISPASTEAAFHCLRSAILAVPFPLIGFHLGGVVAPWVYTDPRATRVAHRRVEHLVDRFEALELGELLKFCFAF